MANLRVNNLTGTGGRNALDGSIFFPPSSYLNITNNSDFSFGTGDFTVECWVYISNHLDGATDVIVSTYQDSSNGWTLGIHGHSPANKFYFAIAGDSSQLDSSVLYTDSWVHLAAARSGSTAKFFINGIEAASASNSTNQTSTSDLHIGTNVGGGSLATEGFISNLRVVKGTALYTTAFTPPTEKLTAVPGTVLLCCQDSKDATQEATGKTIVPVGGILPSGNNTIVRNGDFSDGTTGWQGDSGASISASGGVATVTNGGGDNLYAIKQLGVFSAGRRYRVTGTVNATFSGDSIFRVRAGGDAVSWSITNKLTSGTAYYFDTGTITADGAPLEIGSGGDGSSSTITQFTLQDVKVYAEDFNPGDNVLPPVGVDEGVVFDGDIKMNSQSYMYFPTGDTSQRGRGRGLFGGGYSPQNINVIQYLEIQSMGNTMDFGDLSDVHRGVAGFGSKTRGVFSGGSGGSPTGSTLTNNMEYVTISNTANALDFGDMVSAARNVDGCSNSTRGILFGGQLPSSKQNIIQYSTIASTGNTTDFGDLAREDSNGTAFASSTRACVAGGFDSSAADNVIEYVTIATTGNATNFGDLLGLYAQQASVASSTRGVVFTGSIGPTPSNNSNVIQYVTIASTGDATDFGDNTGGAWENARGVTNSLRGVFAGGYQPNWGNAIYYITITNTGNSLDFGDLIPTGGGSGLSQAGNTSDSHGGLS